MSAAAKRTSIWLVIMAVAVLSLIVGYQLAGSPSGEAADFGRSTTVDLLGHKDGHKVPPACYGTAPGHDNVREKNKHCQP